MPTLSTVLLSIKGEVRKANLQLNSGGDLVMDTIQKYFKKKDEPECVCCYEYDNKFIFIFGYKKGKKGTENKTELPDPYVETTLFGDALIIASLSNKWDNPVPFTVEQWNTFYNGAGDEGDEDEEGEGDEDEDEVVSAEDEDSVKDDFEDVDSEKNSIIEGVDDEDEPDEVAVPVKRKRATAYNKVDTSGLKEEISRHIVFLSIIICRLINVLL